MSEASLTARCRKYFKKIKQVRRSFYFQKFSDRFSSGIPDFYILYQGNSGWMELKDIGERPDKIQEFTLYELDRGGAHTMWTDNFEDVFEFVEMILKLSPKPIWVNGKYNREDRRCQHTAKGPRKI